VGDMSAEVVNSIYLTKSVLENPDNITISNAHDNLYIYMPYQVIRETEDGDVTEDGIYTNVF
jgi:hypothetical protein